MATLATSKKAEKKLLQLISENQEPKPLPAAFHMQTEIYYIHNQLNSEKILNGPK